MRLKVLLVVILFALGGLGLFAYKNANRQDGLSSNSTAEPKPSAADDNNKSEVAAPFYDQALADVIKQWADQTPGELSVMVREVSGQQRYAGYREDQPMVAASTYKLFVVYAIFQRIDEGKLSLDTKLSDGSTVAQCIRPLIVESSDACAYRLGNLIGWAQLDQFLKDKDLAGTVINNYDSNGGFTTADKLSTAKDQAEIAWRLANGNFASKDLTELLLGYMKRQIWRERIPAGVPAGIEVADKPGFIYAVQNDTGIVYGPKSTYVIAIMSDKSSAAALADLSKQVYDYLN